jgi:hypothetical protein
MIPTYKEQLQSVEPQPTHSATSTEFFQFSSKICNRLGTGGKDIPDLATDKNACLLISEIQLVIHGDAMYIQKYPDYT